MGILYHIRRRRALEKIVKRYNRIMDQALGYNGDERLHFCVGAYQGFQNFIALAPDEHIFLSESRDERERVLNSITVDIERTAELAQVGLMHSSLLAGLSAAHLHCATLCWQETSLASRIAEELAPFIVDGKIEVETHR